ncbi:MAG TPA: hypothetical protein VLS88_15370 [Polyangiales bacterium]|nr:hypothetical protein [Polyangiales bacterium]
MREALRRCTLALILLLPWGGCDSDGLDDGGGGSSGTGGQGGVSGAGGMGGAGGEVCRGPLEEYCSPCDTYDEAFVGAFEGFEICSGGGTLGTLPAAGACDELRWIVTWDTLDQHFEYFDADGTMVGAMLRTDTASLCDGSSFTKDYGMVPDCELQVVVRACETALPLVSDDARR